MKVPDSRSLTMLRIGMVMLVVVSCIGIASAGRGISAGGNVTVGERGLDITACVNGDLIGWWASAPPEDSTLPTKMINVSTRKQNFAVTMADFDGYMGTWYTVNPDTGFAGPVAFNVLMGPAPYLVWQKQPHSNINQVAMSDDGSLVVVASKDGNISAFNQNGEPVWNYPIGGSATSVSIAPDGSRIAAGSSDSGVTFFDRAGNRLWNNPQQSIAVISLSRDGSTVAAAAYGSDDEHPYIHAHLYILDNQGNLITSRYINSTIPVGDFLWETHAAYVWDITLSPDGSRIVMGTGDVGTCSLVCPDRGGNVYVYDRSGTLLWANNTGDHVRDVDLSYDGSLIAAATGYFREGKVDLYDIDGNYLWRNTPDHHPVGVAISRDKSAISATLVDGAIMAFDRNSAVLWDDALDPNLLAQDQAEITYRNLRSSDGSRIFTAVGQNLYEYTDEGARVSRYAVVDEYFRDIAISSDGSKIVAVTRSIYNDIPPGSVLYFSTTPRIPEASFTADPRNGTVPLTVRFTDTSTGAPVTWAWSFGDGTTSTLQNPVHTYTLPGDYTVSLTVSNAGGYDSTHEIVSYITVSPVSLPGYTTPPTDPDGDGIFEDLNGNTRLDFADVVLYFNQMEWIAQNEPVSAFDLNGNGRIDFADIVKLFGEI